MLSKIVGKHEQCSKIAEYIYEIEYNRKKTEGTIVATKGSIDCQHGCTCLSRGVQLGAVLVTCTSKMLRQCIYFWWILIKH